MVNPVGFDADQLEDEIVSVPNRGAQLMPRSNISVGAIVGQTIMFES
jgi:hypothetical protein